MTDYKARKFRNIGTVDGQTIFQFVRKNKGDTIRNNNGAIPGALYNLNLDQNNHLNFFIYKEIPKRFGNIAFIDNNKQVSIAFSNKTYNFYIFKNGQYDLFDLGIGGGFASNFSFSKSKKQLFFSGFSEDNYLKVIDFSRAETKINNLNLFSYMVKVKGKYLYFDSNHIAEDKATPTPVDLYRVKVGDWNNPELLVEFISDGWLPLNDSIVVLTVPVKGRGKQVFYNINQRTYAPVEKKLPTQKVKYEGKEYLLDNVKVDLDRRYKLTEIPEIPKTGYIKDNTREILPLAFHANLPNSQKKFDNTFITEDLLYEAPSSELQKRSKGQLRKLRNAFFARQGYQFSSKDLQEFFGQFDWYHEMVERNQFYELSNDQVVISPQDKKRVELITEIEQQKK